MKKDEKIANKLLDFLLEEVGNEVQDLLKEQAYFGVATYNEQETQKKFIEKFEKCLDELLNKAIAE
jgi:hypothetical protein